MITVWTILKIWLVWCILGPVVGILAAIALMAILKWMVG